MNQPLDLFSQSHVTAPASLSLPDVETMSVDQLIVFLTKANAQYRTGKPIIDDATYDHVYLAKLKELSPDHPYLHTVEPEPDSGSDKVRHTTAMLSTDKAYENEEVDRFVRRVMEHAQGEELTFSITPKLDGNAARLENGVLAKRGNGLVGENISHILQRGVLIIGNDEGAGEVIVDQNYFEQHLAESFDHPRNFVSGLVSSKTLNSHAEQALNDGAVHFVLFSGLNETVVTPEEIMGNAESLCSSVEAACPYLTDGAVISVVQDSVRQ